MKHLYKLTQLSLVSILILFTNQNIAISQCSGGDSYNLSKYDKFEKIFTVFGEIPEISGATYIDNREFVFISDEETKFLTYDGITSTTVVSMNNSPYGGCSDIEAVSYIDSPDPNNPDLHRLAFSEERQRNIMIATVDVSNDITVNYTTVTQAITINGINADCDSPNRNRGIEGVAYDSSSDRIYFGLETGEILYFNLTTALANNNVANPNLLLDLNTLKPQIQFCTFSGMDMLPNGNLVLLATYQTMCGQNDSGIVDRNLIEIDACGCLIDQMDLALVTDQSNNSLDNRELEGVVSKDDDLYVIGEFNQLYKLEKNLNSPSIVVVTPGTGNSFGVESNILVNWWAVNLPTTDTEIDLYEGNDFIANLASSVQNDGTHFVTLPAASQTPPGANYRFKVSASNDPTVFGFSPYFEITEFTCPIDLVLTSPGQNSLDQHQASSTITANYDVNNISTTIFHANTEVLLTDGFVVESGSNFRAYIEGCTDQFQELQTDPTK